MVWNEIKITYPKRDLIFFLCAFFVIETLLIVIACTWKHVLVSIFVAVYFFVISLFAIFSALLFRVQVANTDISVRTRIGRRYQFHCSEIVSVSCMEEILRSGAVDEITLKTKTRLVTVSGKMIGFEAMAGYLLEKLETGEINDTAISGTCKRSLQQYRNEAYSPKKRKRSKA